MLPRKSNPRGKFIGIGIDLISLPRIKKFLSDHSSSNLKRLLTPSEQRALASKKISALQLAKWFAAKEAYFKASNRSWMGLEGFPSIEVKCLPRDRFRVKSTHSELNSATEGNGCFFRSGNLIGAQVIINHAMVTS